MSVPPRERTPRLVGLDLFRAVAVFGMLVAHVGPASWTAGDGFGTVDWQWEVFHSRMPAMFAFAAGLSLNLGARRSDTGDRPPVGATLIRALLLALCGAGLSALGTPVVVILGDFALWFALALPFHRARPRTLLIVAGAWAVLGPALSFLLRRSIDLPRNTVWESLVSGDYPAMTWMPFVLAGLAIGRLDLSSKRVRVRLGASGGIFVAVSYLPPTLFLAAGGGAWILPTMEPTAGRDAAQQFGRLFFRESGVTPTDSWLWLLLPAPHSGSWTDVFGSLGVCALLLAVLLMLGDASDHARLSGDLVATWSGRAVGAAGAVGAMVLSVYAAHIVAIWMITATTGHSFGGAQSVFVLLGFTLGLIMFATWWMRRFRRGPLEWAVALASQVIERTGRRASGGWWHR